MMVEGEPLIRRALSTRSWAGALSPEDYVFVLRSVDGVDEISAVLEQVWPGCRIVMLSDLTEGAMLSAMAGVAALSTDACPLIVDLADILFDGGLPDAWLESWPRELGGVAPHFVSRDPRYSYLRFEGDRVIETAEKRVISDRASAGVYMFRDAGVFLRAAAHSLENHDRLTHAGAFFVCPMMNGVIAQGLEVRGAAVENVRPVSLLFSPSV